MDKAFDQVTKALRDCVSVMERDLHGLSVIQPELAQAKKALVDLDVVDADFLEWSEEGLPPVGDVEVMHSGHDQWVKQTINYIGGKDGMVVFKGHERGEFACPVHSCQFRPVRTPEQIAAEEREAAALDLFLTINWNDSAEVWQVMGQARRNDYLKAIDAGYRKTGE